MYSEHNGQVVITLDHGEYQALLVALGYALGAAVKDQEPTLAEHLLRLTNVINQGNPSWIPYETESQSGKTLH